jgi:hypothetical protein
VNKCQKPNREKAVPVQEKDLRFVYGADDQHVDNPAQTAMKDGGG